MNHKEKCKKMKSIRKTIADKLGIDLHQRECTYQGECKGTCPKCAQEEKMLNTALLKNSAAVATLAMSAISLTGCGSIEDRTTESRVPTKEVNTTTEDSTSKTTAEILDGDVEIDGMETDPTCTVTVTTTEEEILMGEETADTTETTEIDILDGEIEYFPDDVEGIAVYDPDSNPTSPDNTTQATTENIDKTTEELTTESPDNITEVTTAVDSGITTEEIYELEGDVVVEICTKDDIIKACAKYSNASVTEIAEYNDNTYTVECKEYLNEIDPETGTSKIVVVATYYVNEFTGDATDNKGTNFNIYDVLNND